MNITVTYFLNAVFEIAKLNYNAVSYRFIVNAQDQPITLKSHFWYAYIVLTDRLQVYNIGLDCHVSLQDVQVNLLTAMKIRRLINKPYAVTINVYTQTQE